MLRLRNYWIGLSNYRYHEAKERESVVTKSDPIVTEPEPIVTKGKYKDREARLAYLREYAAKRRAKSQ